MIFSESQTASIRRFTEALINQQAARPIVMPQEPKSGFWFGGGNMVLDESGHLVVVGRYRNAGDSRSGVALGTRGLELAIFRSTKSAAVIANKDQGDPVAFEKVVSWSKPELNCGDDEVLSIEGSCLRFVPDGVELFVSTEKSTIPYPESVRDFQKPGAGVWTIDVLKANTLAELKSTTVYRVLSGETEEHLHVKDPFFWQAGAAEMLGFCTHPFNWSSSNTAVVGLSARGPDQIPQASIPIYECFARGTTWDVAMSRGTCVLPLPDEGAVAGLNASVLFYCGGECVRQLDEHAAAVRRPRGYSCEELGGVAAYRNDRIELAQRISALAPMFVSPFGTGCSRYVDVLAAQEGYFATWQQSQEDFSQPLVMNFVSRDQASRLLQ